MSVKYYCDECGAEIDRRAVLLCEDKYRLRVTTNISGQFEHQQENADVCIDCVIKLLKEKI